MILRWLTIILLLLTFGLILLGGVVHSTGSSLACPDWPLCYGEVFPEMKGGVAIEHSHRLLAASIGLLTIILTVVTGRRRKIDRRLWQLSILALTLVIFQGLLGGLTVIYRLPTAVSTGHLATSMLFFATLLWMTLRLFVPERSTETGALEGRWIQATTFVVFMQIVLGGLVRHTGASLACPDIPFCFGQFWPSQFHVMSQLHMSHRLLGMLVGLFVITTFFFIQKGQKDRRVRFLSFNASFLVIAQIVLGFGSVWSRLHLTVVTAHLAGGVLLLATCVALCFFATPSVPLPSGPANNR